MQGRISGGEPGLSLVRFPPARNLETTLLTLPVAKRFTILLRDEQMDDCIGTSVASSKCCTHNPEGPQAVDLVKDLKTDRMSKVLGRIEGKFDVSFGGHTGGGPLGCFACKSCQVVSLLGATPDEVKIWQAFPYKPSFANPMAKRML